MTGQSEPVAFLAGVLLGDAWISKGIGKNPGGYLSLRVADEDFAEAFAAAIRTGFGVTARVTVDERGYWLVRRYNGSRRFDVLRGYEATTTAQKCAWLRGMFDSEGNVTLRPKPRRGPFSWDRRVSMYSAETTTLSRAVDYLSAIGIPTRPLRQMTLSDGHLGTKPIYELAVSINRESTRLFAAKVGSSIVRKQRRLDQMPTSYSDPLIAGRRAQSLGADVRRARAAAGGQY